MEIKSELLQVRYSKRTEQRSVELLHVFSKTLNEMEFTARIKKVIPYMQQINEHLIPKSTLKKL
ncbi:Ankyrin repeat protein, partial [Legionella santicrucis]